MSFVEDTFFALPYMFITMLIQPQIDESQTHGQSSCVNSEKKYGGCGVAKSFELNSRLVHFYMEFKLVLEPVIS